MVLATTDQLKSRADKAGVDLSKYTDDELELEILDATGYMEEETNRVLDEATITDKFFDHNSVLIQLREYPVTSITSITVDETVLDSADYKIDEDTGTIILETDYFTPFDVVVEYKAGFNPVPAQLTNLCLDITLASIKSQTTGVTSNVKQMKEGELSITYDTDKEAFMSLRQRLRTYRRTRMAILEG